LCIVITRESRAAETFLAKVLTDEEKFIAKHN
jgi:hypothetical protein